MAKESPNRRKLRRKQIEASRATKVAQRLAQSHARTRLLLLQVLAQIGDEVVVMPATTERVLRGLQTLNYQVIPTVDEKGEQRSFSVTLIGGSDADKA